MSQKIAELLRNKFWLGLFVVAAVLALATDFVFIWQAVQGRRQTEGEHKAAPEQSRQPSSTTSADIKASSTSTEVKNFTFINKGGAVTDFVNQEKYVKEEGVGEYRVSLYGQPVYGDINSDGAAEAVLVLSEWGGGTGHFRTIYVTSFQGNAFYAKAGLDLGDRVVVKDIKLQGNEIVLPMVVQGPGDGMCCPTQEITKTLVFENNQLKEK